MKVNIPLPKLFDALRAQKLYKSLDMIHWTMKCPFHEEETPSLSINPNKNHYHCYGCGKTGKIDEIPFVLEIE